MIFLFLVAFIVLSCGSPSDPVTPVPTPPPSSEPTLHPESRLLVNYCEQCHSGATFMASEQAFRTSKAPARIANGSMLQRGSSNYNKWGDAQRQTIAFRTSKAPARIANGSMPQRGSSNYNKWGDAQRQTIARFVSQAK